VIVEVPPPGKVRKTSSESRYSKAGIKGTVVYSTRAPAFTIMSRFGSRPAPDTRGVEAFLKKTAIAYGGDPSKKAKFCGMQ